MSSAMNAKSRTDGGVVTSAETAAVSAAAAAVPPPVPTTPHTVTVSVTMTDSIKEPVVTMKEPDILTTVRPEDKVDMTKSDANMDQPPHLAQHDSSVLDLAFAMDCTGSMGRYIQKAQSSIRNIVETIVAMENCNIRLALVKYRDHPPQDSSFVTDVLDFTESVDTMKRKLDACSASGGGDGPEAVADALSEVSKLTWRDEATKICIFISDAPPHGMSESSDGFPNGCPKGIDPLSVGGTLGKKGITMYMVGCEPAIVPFKDFFMTIAHMTGGQYVPLNNASLLAQVIIGGAQEEITLERLMQNAQQHVEADVQAMGGWDLADDCIDELSSRMADRLNAVGGFRVKQLRHNSTQLPEASDRAKKWSKMSQLADLKKDYVVVNAAAEDTATSASRVIPMAMSGRKKKSVKGGFLGLFKNRSPEAAEIHPCPTIASSPGEFPEHTMGSSSYEVLESDQVDIVQTKRILQKMKMKNS